MLVKAFTIIIITDNAINLIIKYDERRSKINHFYIKCYFLPMEAKFHLFRIKLMESTKKNIKLFKI